MVSLTGIATAAVLCDLQTGRIPNALIAVGLAWGLTYQLLANGILGWILFAGGALLPFLLLGGLFYFRMIGAGDVKLLCAAGGFLGPGEVLACMAWSAVFGGVISLIMIYRRRMLRRRVGYLARYVRDYALTGQWKPYLDGSTERSGFCFSVPVLLGIVWRLMDRCI